MSRIMVRKKEYLLSKLENDLRRQILSGKIKESECILTEMQLCKEYNLSRKSVRKALGKLDEDGLLSRVPGKGTFVKEKIVKSKGSIGCIFRPFDQNSSEENFFFNIFSAIESKLSEKDYNPIVCSLRNGSSIPLSRLRDSGIKGFLLDERISDKDLKLIKGWKIPFVLIYRTAKKMKVNYVMPDNIGGAYKLVNYLINLRHRRIAYIYDISPRTEDNFTERLIGYKKALRENGIKFNPQLSQKVKNINGKLEENYITTTKNLLQKSGPTAIFAGNDRVAPYILKAIKGEGMNVPDNISLAGFADMEIASYLSPPLTTVKVFTQKMGEKALEILLSEIENGKKEVRQERIPTKLIVRNSCRKI